MPDSYSEFFVQTTDLTLKGPPFCSFVQLELRIIQNKLDTSEPRPKQNQRLEPRKNTKHPPLDILDISVFNLNIFLALKDFFRNNF